MLQLYFSPMACSLASRIALMEAGTLHGVYTPHEFLASRDEQAQAYARTFRAIQQLQA